MGPWEENCGHWHSRLLRSRADAAVLEHGTEIVNIFISSITNIVLDQCFTCLQWMTITLV